MEPNPKHPAAWSPAHLGAGRKGIISTNAGTGTRSNSSVKKLCLQGTEQEWARKPKLQVI